MMSVVTVSVKASSREGVASNFVWFKGKLANRDSLGNWPLSFLVCVLCYSK